MPTTSSCEYINVSTSGRRRVKWEANFFYVPPLKKLTSRLHCFQVHDVKLESDVGLHTLHPTFIDLGRELRKYREISDLFIQQLSYSHEIALRTEYLMFSRYICNTCSIESNASASVRSLFSSRLEQKISKVAELLEKNYFVLESMLKPFPITIGFTKFTNNTCLFSAAGTQRSHYSNQIGITSISNQEAAAKDDIFTENVTTLSNMTAAKMEFSLARYIPPFDSSRVYNEDNQELVSEDQPYDEASQVIVHTIRDWTSNGAPIRAQTYDWIVNQLWSYHTLTKETVCKNSCKRLSSLNKNLCEIQSILSPVLVPGAGMARLAFEISFAYEKFDSEALGLAADSTQFYYPFAVEAIDSSIVMSSAANHVLNIMLDIENDQTEQYTCENRTNPSASERQLSDSWRHAYNLYPFVSDPFTNEVDTERRWEPATFPEGKAFECMNLLSNKTTSSQGAKEFMNVPELSYTIGDFVSIYASTSKRGMYGSVVTCFFIDTATNIYEYILTIKNLLHQNSHEMCELRSYDEENLGKQCRGGVWINVGPVQWHRNAQLQPTVDELREMIQLSGFEILHWELDSELTGYRHPDDVGLTYSHHNTDRIRRARFTRSEGYLPLKFVAVLSNDCSMKDENNDEDILLSSMEKLRLQTRRRSFFQENTDS